MEKAGQLGQSPNDPAPQSDGKLHPGDLPDLSAAARQAEAEQAVVAAAAAKERAHASSLASEAFANWGKKKEMYGGGEIEDLMKLVDLVDARYLISLAKHDGVLPRGQELPGCAKITSSEAWRLRWAVPFSLPVLVLSYPWLDREHPDKHGVQLKKVAPILELLVTQAAEHAGPHSTVGVMLDFCSLPQQPRTDEEEEKFQRGLNSMHRWYAHPFTHVLLMTSDLPLGDYSNRRAYHERGWCYFEIQMSSLVKNADLVWDYSQYHSSTVTSYERCIEQMRVGRKPPVSPSWLEADIREKVSSGRLSFSYQADIEPVIAMYQRGFIAAFAGYRALRKIPEDEIATISYDNLGWRDEEAKTLAGALTYAQQHCGMVDGKLEIYLSGNCFGESGRQVLSPFIQAPKSFVLKGVDRKSLAEGTRFGKRARTHDSEGSEDSEDSEVLHTLTLFFNKVVHEDCTEFCKMLIEAGWELDRLRDAIQSDDEFGDDDELDAFVEICRKWFDGTQNIGRIRRNILAALR